MSYIDPGTTVQIRTTQPHYHHYPGEPGYNGY
jgi:hypothetical protein